ncbi:MAG: hypothetical protein PUD07_02260 [bacterium]|nr:hypothetical protein [bacterium]
MKDIIIIGTGKASLLHYRSYKKIKVKGNIYFVDIKKKSNYIVNQNIYSSIKECVLINDLKVNNLIVDICTPKSEFLKLIEDCYSLNIKDILVEKPFVFNEKTINKINKLNIVMVENYLYSKLTELIKSYIDNNNKKISLIYSNFSKNRIPESLNGRGYNKKATLNYEIEIPHQIYISQYFLNNSYNIKNIITSASDLKIENITLVNHGYGLIISRSNDVDIIYESNLASMITQKRIIICTKDDYAIEGNYAIYSNNLELLKPANMSIYYNGKLIYNEIVEEDDNFTCFINKAYLYFNNQASNPNYIDIISFSNIMNLYCNNLLKMENKK